MAKNTPLFSLTNVQVPMTPGGATIVIAESSIAVAQSTVALVRV